MSRWHRWGIRRKLSTSGDQPPSQDHPPLLSPNLKDISSLDCESKPPLPPNSPLHRRESSILSRRTSLDDAARRQRQAYIRAQSLEHADAESLQGPFRIRLPQLQWQDGYVELIGMTLKIYDSESPMLRHVVVELDLTNRGVHLVQANADERVIVLENGTEGIIFLQGGALPPYFGEWVDLLKRKMLLQQVTPSKRPSQIR